MRSSCRLNHSWILKPLRSPAKPQLLTFPKTIGRRSLYSVNISRHTSTANTHFRKIRIFQSSIARNFVTAQVVNYLTPPAVFIGLLITLWAYKCLMMIVFQNKIIYMPSVPPFSRRETIDDYAAQCAPILWQEQRIRSLDGTKISLCLGNNRQMMNAHQLRAPIYILYFQGNASSLPPRLPLLSTVLKGLPTDTPCTIIALSYRGFWSSSGSPSQSGIEKDASAAVKWVQALRDKEGDQGYILFWGQSIGAGVALNAAAKHPMTVDALILETPFLSIKQMLVSLYPQRWLPYRYLWPFLRNHWDSEVSLHALIRKKVLPILIITAERDEVVPTDQGRALMQVATDLQFPMNHVCVPGALHHESLIKAEGRRAVIDYVKRFPVGHYKAPENISKID